MTSSAGTAPIRPLSSARRFSKVYVEVPASPRGRNSPSLHESPRHGLPLSPYNDLNMSSSHTAPSALKRKRSSAEIAVAGPSTMAKKQKLRENAIESIAKVHHKKAIANKGSRTDGLVYCHQCSRSFSLSDCLQCTFADNGKECSTKYCRACLRNRYSIDLDEIVKRGLSGHKLKDRDEHRSTLGYLFKCPRSNGSCNCRNCRKAQGLAPTGKMESVADVSQVSKNNASESSSTKTKKSTQAKHKPAEKNEGKSAVEKLVSSEEKGKRGLANQPASAPHMHPSKTPRRIPKPKPAPRVRWDPVPVPSSFTLTQALQRIHIHDFALRFASILGMSRQHLDELSDIGGRHASADDSTDEEDVSVAVGWVSEACACSLVLGLLSLACDLTEVKDSKEAHLALTIALKSAGGKYTNVTLTRLWGIVSDLRSILDIPAPLPPPKGAGIHQTRSSVQAGLKGLNLTTAAQLLPVVNTLINAVLESPRVRQELEEGLRRARDLPKDERDCVKAENDRWNAWRQGKQNKATKVEREKHKSALASYGSALSVASHANALRFAPLGTDSEGRVYVVAAPDDGEREAAVALLSGKTQASGKARSRDIVTVRERESLRRWSWFVAVYGLRPLDALPPRKSSDEEEEDPPRWWGFWEPTEIHQLADWVAHVNGLGSGSEAGLSVPDKTESSPGASTKRGSAGGSRSTSATAVAVDGLGPKPIPSSDDELDSDDLAPLSSVKDESLSPLTSDEDDHVYEGETGSIKKRVSRDDIKQVVQGLREYANVLVWRAQRMERDDDVAEKGKSMQKAIKKTIPIPPATFYG